MKKQFLSATVLFAATSLFAAEYGALVNNSSEFNFYENDYSEAALSQEDSLTAWVKIPLSSDAGATFSAEALVKYSLDKTLPDGDDKTDEIIADVSLFKFSIPFDIASAKARLNLGRFFYTESTQAVISQPLDAVNFSVSSSVLDLSLTGGYTGLLNAKTVTMLSAAGEAFSDDPDKDFYDFAVPYAVVGANLSFPYLFYNQSITLEGFAVLKAEGPSDAESDENRIFATGALNGPLSSKVFYSLSTTFLFDDGDIANLSSLSLFAYPDFYSSCITASAVYASGDAGPFSPFTSLTKETAVNSAEEKTYSGLIKGGLSYSILPVKNVRTELGAEVSFDANDSSPEYYGTELSLGVSWNIFTDVSLRLGANTFIADTEENDCTKLTLDAAISF